MKAFDDLDNSTLEASDKAVAYAHEWGVKRTYYLAFTFLSWVALSSTCFIVGAFGPAYNHVNLMMYVTYAIFALMVAGQGFIHHVSGDKGLNAFIASLRWKTIASVIRCITIILIFHNVLLSLVNNVGVALFTLSAIEGVSYAWFIYSSYSFAPEEPPGKRLFKPATSSL